MNRLSSTVLLLGLLGGCAVYPDGRIGPLPPSPPPGVHVPPPAPPVVYAPPAYAWPAEPGVPVYVVPTPPPPPVVVTPSIGIGIGLGWGRGHWGRPYRHW
jgi:hypothetical protein